MTPRTFKTFKKLIIKDKKIRFSTEIHNINIRQKYLLFIPSHRMQIYKKSFSYCFVFYFNQISSQKNYIIKMLNLMLDS